MPLSGTPAPNKRKRSTKLIMEINPSRAGEYETNLNLGKKISVPRDIMLEELSLLTNKGSKMFKLRQKRVEKFIYENNPDVFSDNSVDHFQKFIPSVGGQFGGGVGYGLPYGRGQFASGSMGSYGYGQHQHPSAPGSKPGSGSFAGGLAGGAGQAGGPGGGGAQTGGSGSTGGTGGQDQKTGAGGKQITVFKTYISPWEKAMGISTHQPANLGIDLLNYDPRIELSRYKSFNRTAMPYGGYEKASKLMTFHMPEFDAGRVEPVSVIIYDQGMTNRPTFNRTPVPWLGSGEMNHLNAEHNVPMDGETEEL
ncbi:myozenin-1 [Microcaecilia unicolor]|uniref:Myozenin-1 n=1 Tax=Microcaecilia unicolor TaxID=1415580 RepID=A0A6P7Y299_9AMPH|nr:myozenin-1 [Microcaecilia unicolor]